MVHSSRESCYQAIADCYHNVLRHISGILLTPSNFIIYKQKKASKLCVLHHIQNIQCAMCVTRTLYLNCGCEIAHSVRLERAKENKKAYKTD